MPRSSNLNVKKEAKPKVGGRRSRKKKRKIVEKKEEPKPVYDEEEYDDYEEDDMDTLIETLSGKLKFHIFNPDKYEIETHKNIIIVPPEYRKTSEIMTEYEFTEVISHRAKQIENGSPVFTDVGNETDPIKMAELEIKRKKCPLAIRRIHNGLVAEVWHVNEMLVP